MAALHLSPSIPRRPSLRHLPAALGLALWGVGLLVWPGFVRDSVAQSTLYCITSLVPSLFPFMVLVSACMRSPGGAVLGKLLSPLTRRVFRLPACCGAALLLSFFGGYPAGARCVSLLWEQQAINREQAGRMLLFCINPGPAFVVTFLGYGVLGSPAQGWLLFFSVSLGSLLLGLLSGLGKPLPPQEETRAAPPPAGVLPAAVWDASSAVVKMCGCILLFAGWSALLRGSGLWQEAVGLLSSTGVLSREAAAVCLSFFLEVTGGTGEAARLGAGTALYALGLGFGGLCIHLQVFSFFHDFPCPRWKFFLFRLLHGIGSLGIYLILERLLPRESQLVWASAAVPLSYGGTASTWAGGLSLVLLCGAFLVFTSQAQKGKNPLRPRKNHGTMEQEN